VGFQETAAPETPSWRRPLAEAGVSESRRLDLVIIFISSMAFLVTLILWLDNAQGITSNGVFKAVTIKRWVADAANTHLDPSNYLYYPFMGVLCRLLDLVDVFPGDPRRQLTIINAFSASLCLCVVYLFAHRLTGCRPVAWAAVAFHLSCAFFLNLAVINEDIMPSYTLMFASMALAGVWFFEPTKRRVAIVSIVFTLGWLFEWRLMFPTLPAMLLALALTPGGPLERLGRVVLFLAVMLGVAEIAILLWGPQNSNPGHVTGLLWTGKGVAEGWAGFSTVKLDLLWAGMTQYLAGGANAGDPSTLPFLLNRMLAATPCLLAIAALSLAILWRNRRFPEARILAAIFGVTFAAGEIMNFYSQPQDPQMQINVMAWLTVGWILILGVAVRWRSGLVLSTAFAISLALLAYNVSVLAEHRGEDAAWRGALERIDRQVDASRTIFLLHGFEQQVSEMYYNWDGDWDYFEKLKPAPAPKPKFKLLTLVEGPIHKPQATGPEIAEALRLQIERSMNLGYDVVANVVWTWNDTQFEASLAAIASADKAKALRQMLHENFVGLPIFTDPVAGPYFRLQRR
jgi:hypothetical protein